jgi:hypothetical protein
VGKASVVCLPVFSLCVVSIGSAPKVNAGVYAGSAKSNSWVIRWVYAADAGRTGHPKGCSFGSLLFCTQERVRLSEPGGAQRRTTIGNSLAEGYLCGRIRPAVAETRRRDQHRCETLRILPVQSLLCHVDVKTVEPRGDSECIERRFKMRRKLKFALFVAGLCALADCTASAKVIHVRILGVVFTAPGGISDSNAAGTFDYDTGSQTISNISIVTGSGTLDCYETGAGACQSNTTRVTLQYTGSNYSSSGGATAQVIPDSSNLNNQQIVLYSNASGGSVTTSSGGTAKCNTNFNGGCELTLTIPANSLNAGGTIKLVSDSPNGSQSTAGSADPQGSPYCAFELFPGAQPGENFIRYNFTCGILAAGGGSTGLAMFMLLAATYTCARVWRRRTAQSV